MSKHNYKVIFIFCIVLISSVFISFSMFRKPTRQNDDSVNLIVNLDNIESGEVTAAQLSGANTVAAMVINALDGTAIIYRVNSYTFIAVPVKNSKDSTTYKETAKGNLLSSTMKSKIAGLKPGSLVIIKNVNATSPQNMNVRFGKTIWKIVADPTIIHK